MTRSTFRSSAWYGDDTSLGVLTRADAHAPLTHISLKGYCAVRRNSYVKGRTKSHDVELESDQAQAREGNIPLIWKVRRTDAARFLRSGQRHTSNNLSTRGME